MDGNVVPLTAEQVRNIQYFHKYKGDMSRFVGYEACLPALEAYHPEVLHALQQLVIAERTLTTLVEALEEPDDD